MTKFSTNVQQIQQKKTNRTAPFKILSLDGGGIKGLYTATLLAQLEKKLGNPVASYFDMICGTSTGGLIALALTCGIPPEEIATFYKIEGPNIFPYECWAKRKSRFIKQIIWGGKYRNIALRNALEKIIGSEKTMLDANHLLCIPTFNITKGRPTVFKYPHGPFHRDGRIKMLDVALATSAAPTYLPIVAIEGDQFVDGGIWANNPVRVAYTEAMDYFIHQSFDMKEYEVNYDHLEILSIGTPCKGIGEKTQVKTQRSFLGWKDRLIKAAMSSSEYIAEYQVRKLIDKQDHSYYHRIKTPDLSPHHFRSIDMDLTSPRALATLETFGQETGDIYTSTDWCHIERFFSSLKTFKV